MQSNKAILNFNIWFAIQLYFSSSCIMFYPYGGYIALISTMVFLWYSKPEPLGIILVISIVALFSLFYYIPRPYGPPNTTLLISILNYALIILLFDLEKIKNGFIFFSKTLVIICGLGLFTMFLLSIGVKIPYYRVEEGPQIFNVYFPFYIDRINISKDIVGSLIGSARFHGPFFEPGALGVAMGFSLWTFRNKYLVILAIFFGMLSLSASFLFLLFLFIIEKAIYDRKYYPLILILLFGVTLYIYNADTDSFLYNSSVGRLTQSGDKVLNTRTSIYETEQIKLFERFIEERNIDFYAGIGWDTPGSGGSYRVWFLGLGLMGFIIWLISFLIVLRKSKFFKKTWFIIFLRLIVLSLFFYTHGNWTILFILLPLIL